jgi:hypothetical protein
VGTVSDPLKQDAAADSEATKEEKPHTTEMSNQHDVGGNEISETQQAGDNQDQAVIGENTGTDAQITPDQDVDKLDASTSQKAPTEANEDAGKKLAETGNKEKEKKEEAQAKENVDEKQSTNDASQTAVDKSKPKGLRGASKARAADGGKNEMSKEPDKKESPQDQDHQASNGTVKKESQTPDPEATSKEPAKIESKTTNDQAGPKTDYVKPKLQGTPDKVADNENDKTKKQEALTKADVVAVGRAI